MLSMQPVFTRRVSKEDCMQCTDHVQLNSIKSTKTLVVKMFPTETSRAVGVVLSVSQTHLCLH